ncbi:MAG: HD domain-containing protein [Coriobacteriia bacterium]|nr:HD domain-containing protein [Coriobacteriia bacterium]
MWRDEVVEVVGGLKHLAWGPSHCRRVYSMSAEIVGREGLEADDDVLFAVSWLHDIGTFPDHVVEGESPAECSARAAEGVLRGTDFPAGKIQAVTDIIRSHDFERPPLPRTEARVFHDADMLDFMGAIGITRLLAIVGLEDWTPDTRAAVDQMSSFADELPGKLVLGVARHIAHHRKAEMHEFLDELGEETEELASL